MKLDVIKLAKEAECHPVIATKWHNGHWRCTNANLERFAGLVIEECAKECEEMYEYRGWNASPLECASAIRELKDKE